MRLNKILWLLLSFICIYSCEKNTDNKLFNKPRNYKHNTNYENHDSSLLVVGVGYYIDTNIIRHKPQKELCLFKDKTKIFSIPIGANYYITDDPCMHRLIGTDLYTDYYTNTTTIISKNGIKLFEWDGADIIYGFIIKNGDIYTLSSNRKGLGISFRKNGQLIFNEHGAVLTNDIGQALYEDNDHLYFSYTITYSNKDKTNKHTDWYIFKDTSAEKVDFPNSTRGIYNIKMINGILYKVIKIYDFISILYNNKNYTLMKASNDSTDPISCSLKQINNTVYITFKGFYDYYIGPYNYCIIKNSDMKGTYIHAKLVNDWDLYNNTYYYAYQIGADFYINYGENKYYNISKDYAIVGFDSIAMENGNIAIGLSPNHKHLPAKIWHNNKIYDLPLNGYISTVKFYAP